MVSKAFVYRISSPKEIYSCLEKMNLKIRESRIFIKPNIVVPAKPKTGIVSDPEMVKEIIHFLRDKGFDEIIIGEAPGLKVDADEAFNVSGFARLAEEENVKLINLNNE
ncbi:MAG: DUF362 domain-containing protein, partial [Candidatus Jordarchaeaceae archaeon]